MIVSIKDFKNSSKMTIEIESSIPIMHRNLGYIEFEFSEQPYIKGSLEKKSSNVYGEFEISMFIKDKCSRCLDEKIVHHTFLIDGVLSNEEFIQENEDIILIHEDILDLEHILDMALIEYAPSKILCDFNCKGLCESCGTNLNHSTCNCSNKNENIDPRLTKLKDLLNNNEGGALNGSTKEKNS